MRTLLLFLILLPIPVVAEEVKIAVGMKRDEVISLIKKHSAHDITPGMAIESADGKYPVTDIYWEFRDYDAILELSADEKDDKIEKLSLWNKKDFKKSILSRSRTRQSISALKLDTKTKEVTGEKKKPPEKSDQLQK